MSNFADLVRVCFDFSVFKRVATQRAGRTWGMLFILVLLSTLAGTISIMLVLRDLARKVDPYLGQIPTVTIKDGKASSDVPQPWIKKFEHDDKGRSIVLILDTTGQRTDFEPNELGLLVEREQLNVKSDDQQRQIPLSQVPDMVVGPDTVRDGISKILHRAPFWIAGFAFFYFFLIKMMQGLLFVLPSLIGASGRKRSLGFGELFSVAVYAMAPAVLLDCVLDFLPFHIPHFWLVYFAIASTYAVLGARAAADATDATPPAL